MKTFSKLVYGMVKRIVDEKGGFRERDIFYHPHLLARADTWNGEHKVVHVISDYTDNDGHHDSFSVDIATGRICG